MIQSPPLSVAFDGTRHLLPLIARVRKFTTTSEEFDDERSSSRGRSRSSKSEGD
jgi:hypothetical protein